MGALVTAQRIALERGIKRLARAEELDRATLLAEHLAERYVATGDWSFLEGIDRWPPRSLRWRPRGARHADARPPGVRPRRAPLWGRVSLRDADNNWLAGSRRDIDGERLPISVDNRPVGYLILAPLTALEDELQIRFERQQARLIVYSGGVALVVASLGAALLSRSLATPIRELTQGARAVADGDYAARVRSDRGDELGQLAQSFNQMAAALSRARQARRQWVADIAHELRTPISVLRGELEAIEDGLRQPDARALASLAEETRRLGGLVDDLHQLALADDGALALRLGPLDLADLFGELEVTWRPRFQRAGLELHIDTDAGASVTADRDRVRQMIDNLLENALRYTDAGGRCHIVLTQSDQHWAMTIDDTPPAVPDDALPRLFDRLYRVDPSRTRDTGASGLGLAIVKSLAEAHGGTVAATQSALGGLSIAVTLPREPGA